MQKVYDMPGDGWEAITDVPCPVDGCGQTLVWYEAGYAPGYRVCMAVAEGGDGYNPESIRHRFSLAPGPGWRLVRDDEAGR